MQTVRVPSSSSDVAKQSVIIDYDDKVGVRLPGGIELVWQKVSTTTKQELLGFRLMTGPSPVYGTRKVIAGEWLVNKPSPTVSLHSF